MNIGILRNEDINSAKKWQLACINAGYNFTIIDLTSYDWLQQILNAKCDFWLLKPPGLLSHYKILYDERVYILNKVLKLIIYPSYEECFIYENKKLLCYFLEAANIPHPKTLISYNKHEAKKIAESFSLPIVSKTSIGASGSGVFILKTRKETLDYISKAFSSKGIKRRFGPNRVTGSPNKWLKKTFSNPSYLFKKIKEYFDIFSHGEKDFVIFQEFVPHDFEWRAIRIGESYFVHKKIKHNEKASGSKGIDYVNPPESILNFAKKLCESYNFNFMAIDIFEDDQGGFLVNELQTIFGHVQDYIMAVDGIPGRYKYLENHWVFEHGSFNSNESYDLRLSTAIELYGQSKKDFDTRSC